MQTMDGKSEFRTMSALVFQTVLIVLLARFQTGEAVGQHQVVEATIGITDDVTLPCHVEPATDATDEMLEWSRLDLNPRFIHVRRDGEDHPVDQNPSYVGRTSVSVDGLKQGNMSMRLSTVRLSDEGTYRCFSPGLKTDSTVQLIVAAVIEITKVSAGVLECKSAGWYLQPEMLWLDGEGNLLSAESAKTDRGPDDLYTVSSRVTVEKKHGNNFTCRVQQNNEHRDAKFHVSDPSANSAIAAVIGLILFALVALAFALVAWRQNKIKSKENTEDEESQSEGSEKEPMMKNEEAVEKEKLETQMNPNKVEGENNTSVPETSQKVVGSSINGQQRSDEQSVKSGTTPESEPGRQPDKDQTDKEKDLKKTQNQQQCKNNVEGTQSGNTKPDGEQNKTVSKTNESEINSNIPSENRDGIARPGAAEPTIHQENVSMTAKTADQSQIDESKGETSTKNSDTTGPNPPVKEDKETREDSSAADTKTKSEETLNSSTTAVNNGKDELPGDTKKIETNLKDGEEAKTEPAKTENEDKTREDSSAADTKTKSEETLNSSTTAVNNGKDELPGDTKIPATSKKDGEAQRDSEEAKHPGSGSAV